MGLALAGGGFRASLFHIGVLRRMAELDLLRHVEVLSVVSGGAIVGAMYTMQLKGALVASENKKLSKSDYVRIVVEVQRKLCEGIRKDIRTRLLVNPFRVCWMIVSWSGLGAHLATLIDRHFLGAPGWWPPWRRRNSIRLNEAQVGEAETNVEDHNGSVRCGVIASLCANAYTADVPRPSALTKLVINSTCLNSGDRFWFTHDEIGDWRLGHFAVDEIDQIARLRGLWQCSNAELLAARDKAKPAGVAEVCGVRYSFPELWTVARLRWMEPAPAAHRRKATEPEPPDTRPTGWEHVATKDVLEQLARLQDLGYLRLAKNAAKTLASDPGEDIETVVRYRFRRALVAIDDELADNLAPLKAGVAHPTTAALALVQQVYVARMANYASREVKAEFTNWRLAQAVAASANFPPVFPPYKLFQLFADWYVSRLGLTDGGVFENSGVQALIDDDCTCIVVSDPGSPFSPKRRSSVGRWWLMRRVVETAMTGVSWRQRLHIETLWNKKEVDTYAWIEIDGPQREPRVGKPPIKTAYDAHAIARLRTDLDAFGDVEIAALINHGYDRADRYLRRYLIDEGDFAAVADRDSDPKLPAGVIADPKRLGHILWAGRHRGAKPLFLVPWWLTALSAAAMIVVMWWRGALAFSMKLNLQSAIAVWDWLHAFIGAHRLLAFLFSYPSIGWWLDVSVAVLALALLIEWVNVPGMVVHRWGERSWVVRIRLGLITDRVRGLGFNLLWFVPPLLLPWWIALTISVGAWLKYLCVTLPFRRMTTLDS